MKPKSALSMSYMATKSINIPFLNVLESFNLTLKLSWPWTMMFCIDGDIASTLNSGPSYIKLCQLFPIGQIWWPITLNI